MGVGGIGVRVWVKWGESGFGVGEGVVGSLGIRYLYFSIVRRFK